MRRFATVLISAFLTMSATAIAAEQSRPPLFLIFFKPWSAELDAGNQKMIQAAAAKAKATRQSHITVLGYADMEGSAKANLDLTKQRVETVRQSLIRDGYPDAKITVEPFGSVKPIGDSQESRRVEITIRTP
jgi:outer membrane protein OmpA-like peptidoglycan-associated protein